MKIGTIGMMPKNNGWLNPTNLIKQSNYKPLKTMKPEIKFIKIMDWYEYDTNMHIEIYDAFFPSLADIHTPIEKPFLTLN